ncbi:hypothetical protein [Nguyenibacter sp. L1]|uniref:hypothetical protein n=1 Tax=Nguyenibacter sp. L1 TaxID=3049350 RepID=UPI002B486AA9|nr:hypothetical protein [Nguyenibacter sp. L1]WRH89497.1 hypothetical protein QN315_07865 [Nguyenibacter sp. L1]
MMQADDWLNDRPTLGMVQSKFDRRTDPAMRDALRASLCRCDAGDLDAALIRLLPVLRAQIAALHTKFTLARPLANDFAAIALISP